MDFSAVRDALRIEPEQIINSDELCLSISAEVEAVARYTAQHLDDRERIILELSASGDIWDVIGGVWKSLVPTFHPTEGRSTASDDSKVDLAVGLGKLERNLIAGLAEYQARAVDHEPYIRQLIFNITTFNRIEDERYSTIQTIMTQLLVNMVSPTSSTAGGDRIADEKLQVYLGGKREDDVVIRLLDSKNAKVNIATLHLISNLIRNSPRRQQSLLSLTGISWLSKILARVDEWHDYPDGRFELSTSLFLHFWESNLQSLLFASLQDDTEPITPVQTTLLKFLDAYLADSSSSASSSSKSSSGLNASAFTLPSPNVFLVGTFRNLAKYALVSMESGMDDPRLPKVFEGTILVIEGLSSIGLAAQTRRDEAKVKGKGREETAGRGGDEEVVREMKDGQKGLIKPLIDFLRRINVFLPRVKPGSAPTPPPPLTADQQAPIASLKRNLVRLLGILTFEDISSGDQVREAGGVELVLSLTEVDGSNPYLREHALFAVRNLMLKNPANQAIINQMNPLGVLSETGEVLPLPEKMKGKVDQPETIADNG